MAVFGCCSRNKAFTPKKELLSFIATGPRVSQSRVHRHVQKQLEISSFSQMARALATHERFGDANSSVSCRDTPCTSVVECWPRVDRPDQIPSQRTSTLKYRYYPMMWSERARTPAFSLAYTLNFISNRCFRVIVSAYISSAALYLRYHLHYYGHIAPQDVLVEWQIYVLEGLAFRWFCFWWKSNPKVKDE